MDFNIKWDQIGERYYETGCDRGVLFLQEDGEYGNGVGWSGLISVSQNPSGAEATPLYADNIKYLNLMSREEFGATIGCYCYPPEFAACCGEKQLVKGVRVGQQSRSPFGFTYRTKIGNDEKGSAFAYKIHLVYGALASPSTKDYQTEGDTPEAAELSYEVTTTPVDVSSGFEPTAHLEIDSRDFVTEAEKAKLAAFEQFLYGTAEIPAETEGGTPTPAVPAKLPLPSKVAELLGTASAEG